MAEADPATAARAAAAEPISAGSGEARIAAAFEAARVDGRAALMPYMMGCFPDKATSMEIAAAYADAGADLIELGVPFSDPLADGPVIQAAATRALAAGATLEDVLEVCATVAERLPVVTMCYANMVLARGSREFATLLAEAGAAGAIVPDLPLEEQGEIGAALADRGLALVPLVAPTTPPDRRAAICRSAHGFVYVVSTTGTTGERDQLPAGLAELVAAVRAEARVPAAVGFGISTPEQAAAIARIADGVIIGSRLIRAAGDGGPDSAAAFLRRTRAALTSAGSGG